MPLLRQLIDDLFQFDSHNNITLHVRVCELWNRMFFHVIESTNAHFDIMDSIVCNLNTAVKLSRVSLIIYNQLQKFLKTLK